MVRNLLAIFQWMKRSKSYRAWVASTKESYERIRRLFSWRRRFRSRAKIRPVQPNLEMLEARVVPTISIGTATYPTLAAAVAAASPDDTINIDTTGMPTGGYVGGVTISTSLTIAGPTSGTLPTICAPTTSLSGRNNAIFDVTDGASVTISDVIVDGSAATSTTALTYGIYVGGSASLTLNSSTIQYIQNSFTTGVGLQAGDFANSDTGTVNLTDDVIGYYDAGAVIIDGPSSSGTITDCVVAANGDAVGGPADDIQATNGASDTITKAIPTLQVSDAGGSYTGSAYPATVTVAGVSGVYGSTLEGISPVVTYYDNATGILSATAPSAGGTYTVFASFPGSTDYQARRQRPQLPSTPFPLATAIPRTSSPAQTATCGSSKQMATTLAG
jgi:large repetitive protein